jgi:peptide deformylase|tara:strand:- start:2491 stop:3048 length:558 start_codon:yes stop_codon:yes gene_type:complete
MAIRDILKMGNPLLREVAAPIHPPFGDEIEQLVADMQDSLAAVGGVGLAAPQIGVSKSLVIFEVPEERVQREDGEMAESVPATILINPVIEPLSDDIELGWEGCLSVPGLRGLVPRHTHIRYRGLGIDGGAIDVEARGFHARVVQHECDHLFGILYPERMTDMRYLVYESEVEAFMEGLRTSAAE